MVHTAPAWMMWLFVFYYIVTKLNKKKTSFFVGFNLLREPGSQSRISFPPFFFEVKCNFISLFHCRNVEEAKNDCRSCHAFFFFGRVRNRVRRIGSGWSRVLRDNIGLTLLTFGSFYVMGRNLTGKQTNKTKKNCPGSFGCQENVEFLLVFLRWKFFYIF